jgi:hypothetical protein
LAPNQAGNRFVDRAIAADDKECFYALPGSLASQLGDLARFLGRHFGDLPTMLA